MNLEGDDCALFKALSWRLLAVSEEYHNNLRIGHLLTAIYTYIFDSTLGIIFKETSFPFSRTIQDLSYKQPLGENKAKWRQEFWRYNSGRILKK